MFLEYCGLMRFEVRVSFVMDDETLGGFFLAVAVLLKNKKETKVLDFKQKTGDNVMSGWKWFVCLSSCEVRDLEVVWLYLYCFRPCLFCHSWILCNSTSRGSLGKKQFIEVVYQWPTIRVSPDFNVLSTWSHHNPLFLPKILNGWWQKTAETSKCSFTLDNSTLTLAPTG